MSDFWYILKDGKYLTAGAKFTDNFNLAYLYENKEQAEILAARVGGEVMVYRRSKWVVVKDGMYLSNNNRFIKDINEAYLFDRKTSEQYARELKGNAVQVLAK